MVKSICHSNTIYEHWNWASNISFNSIDDFRIEVIKHGFTHVDAPSHMIRNGKSLSECKLDLLCGWAKIIDVSECIGDKPITEKTLKDKIKHIEEGDIVILKSNLNDLYPNSSDQYWKNSPFLEDSGSNLLVSKNIKSLVFDFPQDRAAKDLQFRVVMNKEFTEHQIVLGAGVMHVEHAVNLKEIKEKEIFFCALPIKLPNADGANCTPISISGLEKKDYSIIDHSKSMENNNSFKSFLTLSFEKGDQVQETGFSFSDITHTMFIASDKKNYDQIFENLVIEEFEYVNDIKEINRNDCKVLIINNNNIDINLIFQKIKNKNIEILCLSFQPSISEIYELKKHINKIFINLENLEKINLKSKLILGVLKIGESLISPARIISIS